MSVVEETRVVNGPIDQAWAEISHMGAVQDWHLNVASAVVLTAHDTGIGASRRVEFYSGGGTVETVVEESEQQFTTVEMTGSPMIKKALVTIRTKERSADTTDVTFSIDYSMKFGPIGWLMDVAMMRRIFGKKVFPAALVGLSYHLETGNLVTDSIPDRTVA